MTMTMTKTATMAKAKTFREHPQRANQETFETFDQSDEETFPDQKKTKTNTFREYLQRAILETCDNSRDL